MALYRTMPKLPFNTADNRLYDIADFPQQLVPHTVGLLLKRTIINSFELPNDENGIDAVARAIMSIYLSSANKTAEAVDRVYRLIDSSINGTDYALGVDGKPLALPVLPPNIPIEMDVRGLLLNIYNTLVANGGGALDDDMLAQLQLIVGLLA